MKPNTPEETETERVEELADFGEIDPADWAPGGLGCHELLDRVALVQQSLYEHIRGHPACLLVPEWYRLADEAAGAVGRLYQAVGLVHLMEEAAEIPAEEALDPATVAFAKACMAARIPEVTP